MVGELAGKLTYEPFRFDAAFPLREERFADEKRRIAVAAADMVVEGDTIALSPGTTTTHVARSLRHREGIHIVPSAVNFGSAESSSIGMASSRRPLGVLRSMESRPQSAPNSSVETNFVRAPIQFWLNRSSI